MLTPRDVYQRSKPSMVQISALRPDHELPSTPVTPAEVIGSASAFLIGGNMVTCGHAISGIPDEAVWRFRFESYPAPEMKYLQIDTPELRNCVAGFSDEHSYDFAVLKFCLSPTLPQLRFSNRRPEVGEEVCCLGYPFGREEPTIHTGIISSIYESGPATVLKLDMSINPSNSGGPLISMRDGSVVGVVTRKATGLTDAFDLLRQSLDSNIALFEQARGVARFGGIDMADAFRASQTQIKKAQRRVAARCPGRHRLCNVD